MENKYSLAKVTAGLAAAQSERSEFEAEWRSLTAYLLPGRGIYQTYSKPQKRKLTSPRVINSIGEDSLGVLTSGMHGGLTSPAKDWFSLDWMDPNIQEFEPLKEWIEDCTKRMHRALHSSNFYSIINSFYTEYAGFGNGSLYVGEDTEDRATMAFRFELLTVGEYYVVLDSRGLVVGYYRTIFYTPRQLVDKFGENASADWQTKVKANEPSIDSVYVTVLEYLCKAPFQDKPYMQMFYELNTATNGRTAPSKSEMNTQKPIMVQGFYEMPYLFGRWSTIGSDVYGVGPGSRALPDIKRAQEMEKALLMGAHKTVDPPLNVPARQRNKVNSLPGGRNYYHNVNEVISELYKVNFDFAGVSATIDRVEARIERNFFNDIFLTGSRDPNASPYKAAEVTVREQEKMLRLGPIVERLQHEVFMPMLERCFNIMLRKKMFKELPKDLAAMAGDYKITLISPLAVAQKAMAMQGINTYMAWLGNAAQFDPTVLDNVDADKAAREVGDISGVGMGIMRPWAAVEKRRKDRAEQQAQEKAKAESLVANEAQNATTQAQAADRVSSATAGKTLAESLKILQSL